MSQGKLKKFYHSKDWTKTRLIVLERDFYLCQKCLKEHRITAADTVHHITELTEDNVEKYGLSLDNLISLCRDCHESTHGRCNKEDDDYFFDSEGNLIPKI